MGDHHAAAGFAVGGEDRAHAGLRFRAQSGRACHCNCFRWRAGPQALAAKVPFLAAGVGVVRHRGACSAFCHGDCAWPARGFGRHCARLTRRRAFVAIRSDRGPDLRPWWPLGRRVRLARLCVAGAVAAHRLAGGKYRPRRGLGDLAPAAVLDGWYFASYAADAAIPCRHHCAVRSFCTAGGQYPFQRSARDLPAWRDQRGLLGHSRYPTRRWRPASLSDRHRNSAFGCSWLSD